MKMKLSLIVAATSLALMQGALAADLSKDDQKFLRKAGESGMLEIQASQLAAQKSQHPDVRNFAEMMVRDHTAVDNELKSLAESKGFQLPVELDRGKARLMEKLRGLDGHDFDEEYVEEIAVDAHEDAVDLFEDAADDADDADIKAFASKHLPSLQKHLEMGRQLEDKVDDADDRRDRRDGDRDASRVVPGTAAGADQQGTVVVPPGTAAPANR